METNKILLESYTVLMAGMSDEERNMALLVTDARTMGEKWIAANNAKTVGIMRYKTPGN